MLFWQGYHTIRGRQFGGSLTSAAAAARWEAWRQRGVWGGSVALVEAVAAWQQQQCGRQRCSRGGGGGCATHSHVLKKNLPPFLVFLCKYCM
jgi:hypothetical protein